MIFGSYKNRLKSEQLKLDEELIKYKQVIYYQMHTLMIKCAEDTAHYEHVYHSAIEEKKTEIVRLDALITAKTEMVNTNKITYERIITELKSEIKRLNDVLIEFSKHIDKSNAVTTVMHK